jgi:hypothetical protein
MFEILSDDHDGRRSVEAFRVKMQTLLVDRSFRYLVVANVSPIAQANPFRRLSDAQILGDLGMKRATPSKQNSNIKKICSTSRLHAPGQFTALYSINVSLFIQPE